MVTGPLSATVATLCDQLRAELGPDPAQQAGQIRDRLGEIRCPALIVWGEEDRLVPVRDASEFAWLIPDARTVLHPDTGHMVMLERPERFNADVRAFIEAS